MIGWGFRGPSFDGLRKANLETLGGSARCYFWVTTMIIGVLRAPKTKRREKQGQNPLHLQRLLQTLQTPRIFRTSIKYNPLTLTKPWPVTALVNPVLQLLLLFILSTICPAPNTYVLSGSMVLSYLEIGRDAYIARGNSTNVLRLSIKLCTRKPRSSEPTIIALHYLTGNRGYWKSLMHKNIHFGFN